MNSYCSNHSSSETFSQKTSSSLRTSAISPNPYVYFHRPASTSTKAAFDGEKSIKHYVSHHDQSSLIETRDEALHNLSICRHVIATLEVDRLRRSRTGLARWASFWLQIYNSHWARMIITRVCNAHPKIDGLFSTAAKDLQHLIHEFEKMMLEAECEETILQGLDRLEAIVQNYGRRRRKKANEILGGLRNSIEVINVAITDEFFVDMKRGVFALDEACDYHPGDPQAEEQEREYTILLRPQELPRTVLSPGWYHDWQNIYVDRVRELRQNGNNHVRINGHLYWITQDGNSACEGDFVRMEFVRKRQTVYFFSV